MKLYYLRLWGLGLGIGDWAIPNPQSPIPNKTYISICNNYKFSKLEYKITYN